MKPSGTYKIRYQQARRACAGDAEEADPIEGMLSRIVGAERRTQRIVESLCEEIREGGESVTLRVRRIFASPREIFRVELDRPDLGYQRVTLLGREALESLLEIDDVRDVFDLVARSA
jgi:hypothetical protein